MRHCSSFSYVGVPLPIYLRVKQPIVFSDTSSYLCKGVYPSVSPSIHWSSHQSVHPFVSLSIHEPFCNDSQTFSTTDTDMNRVQVFKKRSQESNQTHIHAHAHIHMHAHTCMHTHAGKRTLASAHTNARPRLSRLR